MKPSCNYGVNENDIELSGTTFLKLVLSIAVFISLKAGLSAYLYITLTVKEVTLLSFCLLVRRRVKVHNGLGTLHFQLRRSDSVGGRSVGWSVTPSVFGLASFPSYFLFLNSASLSLNSSFFLSVHPSVHLSIRVGPQRPYPFCCTHSDPYRQISLFVISSSTSFLFVKT